MGSLSLILIVFAIIIGFFIFLYFVPINLWITAIFSGVRVGLLELVFMRIRKVPPSAIVNALITATKAGLNISGDGGDGERRQLKTQDLETHYLAGGNVPQVIRALISADKANINLTFPVHLTPFQETGCQIKLPLLTRRLDRKI